MRHNQDALEMAKGTDIIEDYKEYVTEDSDDEKAEMIDDIYDEILQKVNEYQQYCAMQFASNNIVTKNKGYQRGTPVLHYNLFADIKYNKKTGVISFVKNRIFTITGLTICTTADVTQLLTPWGRYRFIERVHIRNFRGILIREYMMEKEDIDERHIHSFWISILKVKSRWASDQKAVCLY